MADRLHVGDKLRPGQSLTSANGRYSLAMQPDGNLVEYIAKTAIPRWASDTYGQKVAWLAMQDDGNLVMYRPDGSVAWSTNTHGHPNVAWFVVQDDGNLAVYEKSGAVLWASQTHMPEEFWNPVQVEMSLRMAEDLRDNPEGLGIGAVLTCPATGAGVVVCVGAMIVVAIALELINGDPPFGRNNEFRVVGGHVSEAAKRAGRSISHASKHAGGEVSKIWKRWT